MTQTFTRYFIYLMFIVISQAVKGQGVQNGSENATVRVEQSPGNPAATLTTINFTLQRDSYVNLRIFDPLGNEVLKLASGSYKSGEYSIPVDAPGLRSGIYFYRLNVNDHTETKKLVIRK